MATYYVSVHGNGGNGLTWANAKVKPQDAINLANQAGDKVIIAPGEYGGVSYARITGFAVSGTSENRCEMIGDTKAEYVDTNGQTCNLPAGPVAISYFSTNATVTLDKDYWTFKSIRFLNNYNNYSTGVSFTTSGSPRSIRFEDCWFTASAYCVSCTPYAGDGWTFVRCFFETGGVNVATSKSGGFSSTPDAYFYSCVFAKYGSQSSSVFYPMLTIDGSTSSKYTYVSLTNCTLLSRMGSNVNNYYCIVDSATYSKIEATRVVFAGLYPVNIASTITYTNCYCDNYYQAVDGLTYTTFDRGAVSHDNIPQFQLVPVWDDSSLWKTALSYTATGDYQYDIYGNQLSTSPGGIQYASSANFVKWAKTASSGVGPMSLWAGGITYVRYPYPPFPG